VNKRTCRNFASTSACDPGCVKHRVGYDSRVSYDSIERAEINEAFAAIVIVVARELVISEDIVNGEGGAVAHGHPVGATGAVLTTKLIHSMRRDGLTRGLVTLCIGRRTRHRSGDRSAALKTPR
jgi:acetyl-CoA acetyltransferase